MEIVRERRVGKLTVAEMDEEEHSVGRWWRDLKVLDGYADEVYRAVHAPLGQDRQ